MSNILIIDDDKVMCETLSDLVRDIGHDATCALSINDGLKEMSLKMFDVVFLDVWMPDGNGLDLLLRIREMPLPPEVIIITGQGNPDGAEIAIKNGAWDYVQKPSSLTDYTLPLIRALQYRNEKIARKPLLALKRDGIIGSSPQMKVCIDFFARAAISDANVLITGETGTGKELFALAIHDNSPRSNNNFVVVDCAAIPETLVESILFGYEKAAFTGAEKFRNGLIKHADGGTLFLDEVGDLPLSIQKSFLRVLQERRFRPVGGKHEVESNFRIVTATNQDLDKMVQRGQFRKDLLFRIQSLKFELPPLRKHPEDIKELVLYHTAKLCESCRIGKKGFSPEFLNALTEYNWPGNVRELINTLEEALTAAYYDCTLFPKHLPPHIRIQVARNSLGNESKAKDDLKELSNSSWGLSKFRKFQEETEKQYLRNLISFSGGDIKKACLLSGLSRSRLYALLKEHKIS